MFPASKAFLLEDVLYPIAVLGFLGEKPFSLAWVSIIVWLSYTDLSSLESHGNFMFLAAATSVL